MAFDGHEDQDVAKNSHRNNQVEKHTEQDLAPMYTRARLDGGRRYIHGGVPTGCYALWL